MNNGFFEQVRVFELIARTRSLTAAAAQLQTTQSTVSRLLAALETTMSSQLVRRSTRALTLTEQGEAFLPKAIRLLQAGEAAASSLAATDSNYSGRLRVSCSHSFARLVLLPALADWQYENPKLHLELFPSDQIEPIVSKGIDLAIRFGPLSDSSLVAKRIGRCDLFVVASRDYVDRKNRPSWPRQLREHDCLVLAGRGRPRPWTFKAADESVSVSVSGRLSLSTFDGIRSAVLADLGIAITPAYFWKEELANGKVVRLLENWEVQALPIHAVSPTRPDPKGKEVAFTAFVERTLAKYCEAL